MAGPSVVLQMQRLGDLILSFPLLLWLARQDGVKPMVVGEPQFYEPLMHVSPPAVYLPWQAVDQLDGREFGRIVNLSHRPEAAALAARLRGERRIGYSADEGGVVRVRGAFATLRSSLTQANRHSRLHWADLNALDAVGLPEIAATTWPEPRPAGQGKGVVGLFVGASEAAKRPDAAFWAALARTLRRLGLSPMLLGGPGDADLALEVYRLAGFDLVNACGRMDLAELAAAGQGLNLLITPDTGPMHLAAWTGLQVLNVSLGPVNPWETGPYQPGHFVLEAAMSCRGCWSCTRSLGCRLDRFPRQVAELAAHLARGGEAGDFPLPRRAGLRLWQSARGGDGLFALRPLWPGHGKGPWSRDLLGGLWRAFFVSAYAGGPARLLDEAASALKREAPALSARCAASMEAFVAALVRVRRDPARLCDPDWWRAYGRGIEPWVAFCERDLASDDLSPAAVARVLERSVAVRELFR